MLASSHQGSYKKEGSMRRMNRSTACMLYVQIKTTEQSYMHCWAYFAVVSSTNRLTRLFSRVLKYCGETEAYDQENVTTTDIKLTPREKPPQSPEVKVQHTGSEEFGEKRQKPGRAQKILLTPNLPFDRTVLPFSVREERAFNSI